MLGGQDQLDEALSKKTLRVITPVAHRGVLGGQDQPHGAHVLLPAESLLLTVALGVGLAALRQGILEEVEIMARDLLVVQSCQCIGG